MINQAKIPSLVLMENAGRSAAEVILDRWPECAKHTLVVCGTGNNGGDGFVVARQLTGAGCKARVIALGTPGKFTDDAAVMAAAWLGIGGQVQWVTESAQLAHLQNELSSSQLIVDALFGTGLSKPLSGLYLDAVELLNQSQVPCCALDVPSGLDAETGCVLGGVVKAQATVTFAHPKVGLFSTPAVECVGELYTGSLGIPVDSWKQVGATASRVEPEDIAQWLPPRKLTIHKGIAGRVAVVAGSPGTTGAALLAAQGALRAGAGLVTHVGTQSTIDAIELRVLEAMTKGLDSRNLPQQLADALSATNSVILGPGLGTVGESKLLVEETLKRAAVTVVVDADALTLLAVSPEWLTVSPEKRILTPHVGELARLLKTDVASIESDRFQALQRAVALTHAVVVLKGAYTLVGAPGRLPLVVGQPCPALATGGSGDVLAGIIGALSVNMEPWCAAACGVYWHNSAARRWARLHGCDRGLLAHELADSLPDALAELSQAAGQMSE
jgi:NAD(P)H-hydrate epimerase